ncbi:MAG: hypothetical protein V7629_17220 [Motiliproteus sp.]
MSKSLDLLEPAKQAVFARLVGVSQPAINKQIEKGVLIRGGSYQEWLNSYIEQLRSQAAGRGGDKQANLTQARIEESEVKTALGRIQYHEKLGSLVILEEARAFLMDWAAYANREFRQANERLVLDIKSMLDVDVPDELRDKHVGAAIERVKSYALKLASDGSDSSEGVPATEAVTN